jgi:hypothetical protein
MTSSRSWNTAVGTGLLRLVIGAALMFGYFGVRDMTVGVLTLAATRPGGDVPRAVTWQGVADTTDAALIAAVAASGRLSRPRALGAGALAAVSAAGEFATAARLRRA